MTVIVMSKSRLEVKGIIAPLASLMFLMIGAAYFVSFITITLNHLGYSNTVIGFIHSAYYGGMLLGAFKAEKLIHRVNHIRSLAIFASLCSASILVQSLFINPLAWIALRFVAGYSMAGLYIVIESWLIGRSSDEHRGQTLSIYMITFNVSCAIGQMFLEVIDHASLEAYIVAGVFCVIGVIPICMTNYSAPDVSDPQIMDLSSVLKKSPLGFTGCIITGFILSSIYSFGPTTALEFHTSPAFFMSTFIVGGIVLIWPLGKLSDFIDRVVMLLFVSIALIVPCLLLLMTNPDTVWLFVLMFAIGGFSQVLYPISLSHACDRIDPKSITSLTSLLFLAYGLGSVLGPLITPRFISLFGAKGLFLYLISFSIILIIMGGISMIWKKKIPVEDQVKFVALPETTSVIYDLDPRSDQE